MSFLLANSTYPQVVGKLAAKHPDHILRIGSSKQTLALVVGSLYDRGA